MKAVYITIEKHHENFALYKKLWSSQGITAIKVETMAEGIETVVAVQNSKTQYIYFVSIVSDDIDYLPRLEVLDNVIMDAPILIATSKYNEDEHHAALDKGAFFYAEYSNDPVKNINGMQMAIKRYQCIKNHQAEEKIFNRDGLMILLSQRQVFVNNEPIELTKKEFDLLYYFMSNRGIALSYEDICSNVWHHEYRNLSDKNIKTMIKNLRKKIIGNENECKLFKNLRGFGYKMH